MTILGKGNTTPESLDVRVELNIGCSFGLGQTTQNFTATGGESSVAVNTQSGCNQSAASNDDWISIINTSSGTVSYIVAANYGSQPRTGTINISGLTYTVQQSAATTTCVAPPSGLTAWWRGEGNALDQTGVNNGSVKTGMTYSAGKVGGGFRGAGTINSNRIYVPDSPSLALDRSLAIEGWVRYNAAGNYVIITRGDDRDYGGSYAVSFFNGDILFGIKSAPNGEGIFVGNSNPVSVNQFVHFAGTLDDATGQMKFYLNGSLVNQKVTMIRPYRDLDPTKNPRLAIGNLTHSVIAFDSFNGVIDELSVYNRALSAAEVQAIYNVGTAVTGAIGKCLATQSPRVKFDFDGDGKSDVSVFRPDNDVWYLQQSTNRFSNLQFGVSTDKIVPADYDGDGKTDLAVFRPASGTWYLLRSSDNQFQSAQFGSSSDFPVNGDFNGDGKADLAVFRPSNGFWYIAQSFSNASAQNFVAVQFGQSGDKPVPADYDGDGKTDVAVFRGGTWFLNRSTSGFNSVAFGLSSDAPIPNAFVR